MKNRSWEKISLAGLVMSITLLGTIQTSDALTIINSLGPGDDLGDTCATYLPGGLGACYYDTYSFTVSTTGAYAFVAFYPGELSMPGVPGEHLDGTLFLLDGMFNPDDPFSNVIVANDQSYLGPNYSSFLCDDDSSGRCDSLIAGQLYTVLISSWADRVGATGQPTGPYELTIDGPGPITLVPLPAAVWLMGTAIGILSIWRRSR